MKLTRRLQPLRGPIDMAPLVNVILLLLIFFMLSSSFILQPGIRVDPPRSLFGTGAQSNRLIVTVMLEPEKKDATGQPVPGKREPYIFFNDQLMTMDDLRVALEKLPRGRGMQPLVIKADKSVPLGVTVDIMNAAMMHGLSVVIATRRDNALN